MAITITRDADNKWFYGNDWTDWVAQIVADTGWTVSILTSEWAFSDPSIIEEAETPNFDETFKTYLFASGGTNGESYSITNTITYSILSSTALISANDLTQDRTVIVKLKDQ